MSILNVNKINPVGGGSTITIAGIASVTNNISVGNSVTAGSFVGPVTGNVTGNVTGDATGLSGNPSINTTGIVTATSFVPTQGQLSHRNVIINGAMTISQRGSTFSHVGSSNTNILTMDRWKVRRSGSEFDTTITQSTDSPDGFANSLKITPDAVETPSGSHNGLIMQQPEGQSLQHLAYGTSSAKSVTVSFYAKSGSQNNGDTYSFQMRKYDSSNNTKIVTKAFTVTSSWQRFTMTFSGDTSNDIKNSTDYQGFEFIFHLATGPDDLVAAQPTWTSTFTNWRGVTGQSNFMDNTNNEFYFTGCQLEVGPVATPFEHRIFGDELLRCQRYYQKSYDYSVAPGTATYNGCSRGESINANTIDICPRFKVDMRSTPTVTIYSPTDGASGNCYFDHSTNANRTAAAAHIGQSGFGSLYRSAGDLAHNGDQHSSCQWVAESEI